MPLLYPIFFDLETTGTRPEKDRIVEIAAFDPFRNRSFQSLIHPEIPIPKEASNIHGITDEMVKDAPRFSSVAQEFIDFCRGKKSMYEEAVVIATTEAEKQSQSLQDPQSTPKIILIAHNGETFDIPFLAAAFSRANLTFPTEWQSIDSLKWARKYRKDLPRHSLQYLRQVFDIPENRAHRAVDDVAILYNVFSLMVDDLNYDDILERADGCTSLASFQEKWKKTKGDGIQTIQHAQQTVDSYSLF